MEALRSLDPFGFDAGDPNLYRYVGNSPTNGTDPSGLRLLVTEGQQKPIQLFLGTNNIAFENAGNGLYRVVLKDKGAAWDHLKSYEGDEQYKYDLFQAVVRKDEITFQEFNAQATKQRQGDYHHSGAGFKDPNATRRTDDATMKWVGPPLQLVRVGSELRFVVDAKAYQKWLQDTLCGRVDPNRVDQLIIETMLLRLVNSFGIANSIAGRAAMAPAAPGMGEKAVWPRGFGTVGRVRLEGWHPALRINGRVYVGHMHNQAQELAGTPFVQGRDLYGRVRLDATGRVVEVQWGK